MDKQTQMPEQPEHESLASSRAAEAPTPRVHSPRVAGIVYCLGFLFTEERDAVVLIKKARPDWQRGKFNGIGGHVEAGESPLQAMQREASEEAGIAFAVQWRLFAIMRGADWKCHCFRAFDTPEAEQANGGGDSDEKISYVPLSRLSAKPLLPNLAWLIPLALDAEPRGVADINYAESARVR